MAPEKKDPPPHPKAQATGPIGENIVINELLWRGWVPVNTNLGLRNTPNIDIIAAKGLKSVHLQVKASADKANDEIGVARKKQDSYFNTKDGPMAHFVVFVRIHALTDYECYVVPADVAEKEVARCYNIWHQKPKRDGGIRSEKFPAGIIFNLNKNRPNESNYREKWRQYLDAWHLLEEK